MAAYISLIAYKILHLAIYFVLKRNLLIYHIIQGHRFGVPFPKLQTFSETFWALHIDDGQYEKAILGIFAYLFIYEVIAIKVNFCF